MSDCSAVMESRVNKGDFERKVQEHAPMVARVAASYERRPALQDELVQEVFLALWRALPAYRGEASLKTFVARIAHNVCVSHVRKASREAAVTLEAIDYEPEGDTTGPEQSLAQAKRRQSLLEAIRRLPLNYRQVLTLHLEDLSDAEIGAALGLTPANVAVRLHRARSHLTREFDHDQP